MQLKFGARAPFPSEWLTHFRERFQYFRTFFFFFVTSPVSLTSERGWMVLITSLTACAPSSPKTAPSLCLEGSLVSIRITIPSQRDHSFPWESGSLSITTSKGKLNVNRQLYIQTQTVKLRTLMRLK